MAPKGGSPPAKSEDIPVSRQPLVKSHDKPTKSKASRRLIMPVILALLVAFWAVWDESLLQPPIVWLFLVLWVLTTMSFYHVSTVAPGTIPDSFDVRASRNAHLQKKLKYCTLCSSYKPVRCKHCSVCQKCTLGMDHHCPWVGNCIGFRNRKFFMQFVTYVWLLGNVFLIGLLQHLIIRWPTLPWLYRLVCSALILLFSYASYLFSGFWWYHVCLIRDNFTTLEEMFGDKSKGNELDCGVRLNFQQVFGKRLMFAWVPLDLPSLRPVGDGTFWPTQTLVESEPLLPVVEHAASGTSAKNTRIRKNRALLLWAEWIGGASWEIGDTDNEAQRRHALLAELFDLHDLDGSGYIEEKELAAVAQGFAKHHEYSESPLVPKDVRQVFKQIDTNRDGKIDRPEFCTYYTKQLCLFHDDPIGQLYILNRLVEEMRATHRSTTSAPPSGREATQQKAPASSSAKVQSRSQGPPVYVAGEKIKIFSKSSNAWVDGKVSKAFKRDAFAEGYAVRAGSYKVSTANGYKWISPAEVQEVMRKL